MRWNRNVIDHPAHWTKGQLLDLRRFADGQYVALLLGEEPNEEQTNLIRFESGHDAQAFVSAWYDRPSVGGPHG